MLAGGSTSSSFLWSLFPLEVEVISSTCHWWTCFQLLHALLVSLLRSYLFIFLIPLCSFFFFICWKVGFSEFCVNVLSVFFFYFYFSSHIYPHSSELLLFTWLSLISSLDAQARSHLLILDQYLKALVLSSWIAQKHLQRSQNWAHIFYDFGLISRITVHIIQFFIPKYHLDLITKPIISAS